MASWPTSASLYLKETGILQWDDETNKVRLVYEEIHMMIFKGFKFGMLLQLAIGPVCLFVF